MEIIFPLKLPVARYFAGFFLLCKFSSQMPQYCSLQAVALFHICIQFSSTILYLA